jgi:hypothetical protein
MRRLISFTALILAAGSLFQAADAQTTRVWGALAFTPDGSYSVATRMQSMGAADGKVIAECERLGRGECQLTHFPGNVCVALATYVGSDSSRRNRHSRYGLGDSIETAQRLALTSCGGGMAGGADQCEVKVAFCGDGRGAPAQTTEGPRVSIPSREVIDGPGGMAPGRPPPSGILTPQQMQQQQQRERLVLTPQGVTPGLDNAAYYGAIAFTADGSWATAWKKPTRAEAEADVAKRCAKFGRGGCEVVGFTGEQCVGLATFIGRSGRKNWKLSFTAGGLTGPEAQRAAMDRCNADQRTRGQCQLRTMVCGDGR